MVQMVKQVVLDPEQEAAVEQMCSLKKDVQTLGGLAGTGKTTTIRAIYRRLPNWAVCAYTGKAAQMLRRKGIPSASTIHSLIYRPIFDDNGNVTGFDLKSPEEFEYDGIIVDEASMVGDDVYRDLVSLGVPLIFVGDHGQLEPVRASGFNLMASPDVTLETIHRNAGEIARFAAHLRTGGRAVDWQSEGAVEVLNVGALAERGIDSEIDQIICAYNRTRVELNNLAREHLGLPEGRPAVGDRIMCLQNDRKLHIFNGMQGKLTWISGNRLRFQADGVSVVVRYMPAAFGAEKAPGYVRGVMPFDWCYCVTCHKAQGDEWERVMVVEQRCGAWQHERWAYTAASRAKVKLTWVLEN